MSLLHKPALKPESLLGAWHAQVAETAKKTPWLVRELVTHKAEFLPKFVAHYRQLYALPRRTRRWVQRKLTPSLAGAALLLALGNGQAIAATISVGGGCSLIDAITTANTDTATGGCSAGSGADTISLSASSTHTLTTSNNSTYGPTGLPMVSSTITIAGNSSTIARDNLAPAFRIFAIGSSGNLTLQETTVSGGVTGGNGGGVFNGGSLALSNSTISGNTARYGGGVSNLYSTVTLSNSTISGNSARAGGGVSNLHSMVTLSNSTISGNSANYGGGVFNYASTATLSNSTISGNRASRWGGGVANQFSTATLSNSTISGNSAGNGGGVFNDGALTLSRTLISGNTADLGGAEVHNFTGGTITADNFNLFGHSSAAGVVDFAPGATDLVPSGALSTILNATPASNGGPTPTYALVTGSLAIDASPIDADCLATDQRGVARPQGAACDIGAFEAGHDLAVLKVIPPKTVTLTSKKPVQSKAVAVQIQNQGEVDETIPDAGALAALVQLDLESLDTVNDCVDLVATLDASKLKFPLTLKAGKTPTKGKKLTLSFTVMFDRNECIPDPLKSSKNDPGHEDYRPRARVDLNALGETDVGPTDDALEGQLIDVVKKP